MNKNPDERTTEERLQDMIDAQAKRQKQKVEEAPGQENQNQAEPEESTGSETSDEEKKADAPAADAAKTTEEDEELQTRYLRLAADFQNYKKRVEKEKGDIYAFANEKIVTELLDVIDNFERAIAHSETCSDKNMLEGMEMILKQFMGVLEKSGLQEIEAEGLDFDPNFHHAVLSEANPAFESGKVIGVLQKGYLLNNRVIRPSMVRVAQ